MHRANRGEKGKKKRAETGGEEEHVERGGVERVGTCASPPLVIQKIWRKSFVSAGTQGKRAQCHRKTIIIICLHTKP